MNKWSTVVNSHVGRLAGSLTLALQGANTNVTREIINLFIH
jgi:hypothetical protein